MWRLLTRLAADEVGSTTTAEMAMITSVTVGALFMSLTRLSTRVNDEFGASAQSTGPTIVDQIEAESEFKERQAKRREELKEQARQIEQQRRELNRMKRESSGNGAGWPWQR